MRAIRSTFRGSSSPSGGQGLDFSHPLMRDIRHAFLFSQEAGGFEIVTDLANPAYRATRFTNSTLAKMVPAYGIGGLGTQCSLGSVGTTNFSGWNTSGAILCRVREGSNKLTVYIRASNPTDRFNWDAVNNTSGTCNVSYPSCDDNFGGVNPGISPWLISYSNDGSTLNWTNTIRTSSTNHTLSATSNGNGKLQCFGVTYDGVNQKIYSDGIQAGSQAVSGNMNVGGAGGINVSKYWSIVGNGRDTNVGARRAWFGVLHYILVWERALQDQEMKWLQAQPYAFVQPIHSIRYSLPKTTQDLPLTGADSINNYADSVALANGAAAHYGVVTSDQLSFLDSIGLVGPPPNYKFLFGENALANLQDSANVATKLQVILSDTINNFADAFSKLSGIPIQAFDSQQFNWADAISTGSISPLSVSKSDTVNNFADSVVVLKGNVFIRLTFGDTINLLSDAIRIYSTIRVLTDDNLTMSDSLMTRMNNLMKIGEQLAQLQEGLVLSKTAKPQFADSVNNLADSVTVALTVNLVLHKSDALSLSDSVSVELSGTYNPTTTIDRIRRYLGDLQSS